MENANALLAAAKAAKQDEFYTQWADIEREMNAYLEYDPDVFRDKTVLLPCDDPEWSNFTKYFSLHFVELGLRKLISTSYAPNSNAGAAFYTPTLFETEDPSYDPSKSLERGRVFTLTQQDVSGDGRVDIDDLKWQYLDGDGDFRSAEVTALRDEADFVITNPPFSLFREFVAWLVEGGVQFSIIGNQNAITYKEVFRLIRANQLWLGKGFPRNMAHFRTPYKVYSQWVEQEGDDIVRVPGVQWFTNIEHGRRHEPLQLMTTSDNIKFSKHKEVRGVGYAKYDNFDAIEVPFSDAIPSDHAGVMGVPITFLGKYNPEQFEILGTDESDFEPTKTYQSKSKVVNGARVASNTGSGGAYIRVDSFGSGTFFDVGYPLKRMYKRIFIRHRHPEPKKG